LLPRLQSHVLIVDPAIHSLGGHHYVAVERLDHEIRGLSLRFTCLGSRNVDVHTRKELRVRPCFSETIYGRTDWTVTEFRRRAEAMANELMSAVRWRRPKLVVLPTCDQVVAYAVALASKRSWTGWRPTVLLWLLFPPDSDRVREEYKQAFDTLRAAIADDRKIHVCCETEGMRDAFSDIVGLPIEVRPGPNAAVAASTSTFVSGRGLVVACVGHAHSGKGYNHLPAAIARSLQQDSRLLFKVQGAVNHQDRNVDLTPFERLTALGPRVQVTTSPRTTSEYLTFLRAADLILLPYDPVAYRIRGSGVFNEATVLGKPTIVTAGCGFGKEAFVEGRAVAIEALSCDAIVRAIQQAADEYETLVQRAVAYASRQQTNSLGGLLRSLAMSSSAHRELT
jgi:glycosyltransferase involved in cell wall biosynthesis